MIAPSSPKALARAAGWLYLVIIVGAGLAEGYVRGSLVVTGDAAQTASNILASESLFRLGLVADLIAFLADAAVAVLLYVLLRPVSHAVSLLAAAFRLVAHPAIAGLNLLNYWGALALLRDPALSAAVEPDQLQAMALLSLEAHGQGYLIAGAFLGVHLALLAWLLHRSELFPSLLAVLIGAAAVGYMTETLTYFLVPSWASFGARLVLVTASVGEVALCLWLVVKGVRGVDGAGMGAGHPAAGGR